jgi:predicted GNAT family N-acyltransferase
MTDDALEAQLAELADLLPEADDIHLLIEFTRDELPELFEQALAIRREVFVDEQHAPPETEPDERDDDPGCLHYLVTLADGVTAIATGRMFEDPKDPDTARIGRMAVRKPYRGQGLGALILQQAVETARDTGYKQASLDAQCQAEGFYGKLGFIRTTEPFMLDGIEHIVMTLTL